ncbi:MAG: tRNA pseudouridine(55) synthase TruB [Desulfobacula sp.]|jgi:tRNA pseudouridine55 synthase|uniref:tRNA pseudouridine(55) synthase TruB n=1 Tax=Desulfobacula sp. TaxID=2593537 RepID=UPI001DC71448|nr:tRNA pseudouridine(55) synthase TruB [Desulfobacula sp.]MBT3484251.1 tRNA pseudouridine(55) synthase TruB [Desulfobacula sp.]MBT3804275.1 tRNA pseudouridine(55) synthase TruB [Desulfobacula sp.]MBT4025601.1 tRNA pseudouridine(55) synthase TruB [Desulfobacula sp.]MBT4198177.1 tRNA pseudouridine(55) synthase TruB [Desulfobacula sp.]
MKSGIIAIHKPCGISSARVVARVKKALGAKKVGHTGTLDPFASGLMLCAINKGTRISGFFLGGKKRYLARICLGIETDTYDLTGKTVFCAPKAVMDDLKNQDIVETIKSFVGIQDQRPPAFSALKHKGQPLYKLARQGIKIQKPPRQIEFFDISINQIELPNVDIDVFCSSGTYIRSLAFDLGQKLGCGAHLSKLCRTQSSNFLLENAIELEAFESLDKTLAEQRILSLSNCLEFLPKVVASKSIAQKIKFGQKLLKKEFEVTPKTKSGLFRVTDDENDLLAILQLNENSPEYIYSCVFSS